MPVFFFNPQLSDSSAKERPPTTMPGHIKKSVGPDPDPDPWLIVTPELKVKLKAKPYDAKKSCWVPEKGTGGYLEGLIDSTEGEKVTVTLLSTKDVRNAYTVQV